MSKNPKRKQEKDELGFSKKVGMSYTDVVEDARTYLDTQALHFYGKKCTVEGNGVAPATTCLFFDIIKGGTIKEMTEKYGTDAKDVKASFRYEYSAFQDFLKFCKEHKVNPDQVYRKEMEKRKKEVSELTPKYRKAYAEHIPFVRENNKYFDRFVQEEMKRDRGLRVTIYKDLVHGFSVDSTCEQYTCPAQRVMEIFVDEADNFKHYVEYVEEKANGVSLTKCGLSTRTVNCLKEAGYTRKNQVVELIKQGKLKKVKGIGKVAYDEILTKFNMKEMAKGVGVDVKTSYVGYAIMSNEGYATGGFPAMFSKDLDSAILFPNEMIAEHALNNIPYSAIKNQCRLQKLEISVKFLEG